MAWTKAKTAIVIGAGLLLAAGTTTVVVKSASQPGPVVTDNVDDSYFSNDSQKLWEAPANVVILRPTHFTNFGGMFATRPLRFLQQEVRMVGMCQSLANVICTAYGAAPTRLELPANLPQDKFDYMLTVTASNWEQQRERLRGEVQKQLGLVGRRERREMDVLLLEVNNSAAAGLKRHPPGRDNTMDSQGGQLHAEGQDMKWLASFLELGAMKPVFDQTGLKGQFDFVLDERAFGNSGDVGAYRNALLDQLGLKLVPGRASVEWLVVEKVK